MLLGDLRTNLPIMFKIFKNLHAKKNLPNCVKNATKSNSSAEPDLSSTLAGAAPVVTITATRGSTDNILMMNIVKHVSLLRI